MRDVDGDGQGDLGHEIHVDGAVDLHLGEAASMREKAV
jgi:hypothetical protein